MFSNHSYQYTTDPSAPPSSLSANSTSPTNITITWGLVSPCEDQNTEISDYFLRYAPTSHPSQRTTRVITDMRMFTATGLIPRTEYIVEVRAEDLTRDDDGNVFNLLGPFAYTTETTREAEGLLVVTQSV